MIFGSKNGVIKPGDANFEKMLESILKRCGKYLIHLSGSKYLNEQTAATIIKECQNLQTIEVDGLKLTKEMIEVIKPISSKFKICEKCHINSPINDHNIMYLFKDNEILERLYIIITTFPNTHLCGEFLKYLPGQAIRELRLRIISFTTYPLARNILQVSIFIKSVIL